LTACSRSADRADGVERSRAGQPRRGERAHAGLLDDVAHRVGLVQRAVVEVGEELVVVEALGDHAAGGHRARAEALLEGVVVGRLELESSGDRRGVLDDPLAAVLDEEAPGVVAERLEEVAPVGRAQPVDGLEESGLARFVLADEAGDVGLDGEDVGVDDVAELLDLNADQPHKLLSLLRLPDRPGTPPARSPSRPAARWSTHLSAGTCPPAHRTGGAPSPTATASGGSGSPGPPVEGA